MILLKNYDYCILLWKEQDPPLLLSLFQAFELFDLVTQERGVFEFEQL